MEACPFFNAVFPGKEDETMRVRNLILAFMVTISFASVIAAQSEPESFYWYNGQKIALKKSENLVAAKVLESVDYQNKFPALNRYFQEVGSSSLRDEPVLLQTEEATKSMSIEALKPGVRTKEIYQLPVFEIDETKLVLQNELIIGFKEDQIDSASAEELLKRFSRTFVRQPGAGIHYLVRVPDPSRTLAWADILYRNKMVEYAEPNFVILQPSRLTLPTDGTEPVVRPASPQPAEVGDATVGTAFPTDSLFTRQWALTKIFAPKAWTTSRGSNLIRIAILDDGVDIGHPDLKDKIEKSYDVLFDSDVMSPPADDAHGTAVAGIAAAVTNNSMGIAGLAADMKIIPIRMMSRVDQSTEATEATVRLIVRNAFVKAVELGADVINCSWTMPPSDTVESAIRAAATRGRNGQGALVVFAAGNEGREVSFPASLSKTLPIIAVGASNEQDEFKTTSSSDGEDFWASNFGPELTVVAPGVHITTTIHRGRVAQGVDPFIHTFNGTSSAAPLVSALGALILSIEPTLKPEQVRQRIVSTADLVVRMPDNARTIVGRINACRALGRGDCSQ